MAELDDVRRRVREAGEDAARRWCGAVLAEAVDLAPLDEATLRGSGHIEETPTANGTMFTVVFATPYAARQHEELTWNHPKAGEAKYLEKPFKRRLHQLNEAVGLASERALRQGG